MEVYTQFTQHWEHLYDGIINPDWLDVVLPASAMLVDPLDEFIFVRHAELNDTDYIAKFDEHYGIDLLHVWMNFYHWEGASFGQPTCRELREYCSNEQKKCEKCGKTSSGIKLTHVQITSFCFERKISTI